MHFLGHPGDPFFFMFLAHFKFRQRLFTIDPVGYKGFLGPLHHDQVLGYPPTF